ncbi:MAG: hypothetical protein KatS3mg095_0261 [Candidatus Parcubacteria bacterium]|nr:MAG: hypothetical protein KatS3mg095_0261 [Candidatus Parcubacteria bacterium]
MKKIFLIIYKLINYLNKIERLLIFLGIILSFFLIINSFKYFYKEIFSQQIKHKGILKEGLYQQINTLNPFLAENQSEKTLVNLIYDSLVRPNGMGGYELELAKKIVEIDKGLKYEIEIKEAYWSNGERITAKDVLDSFYYLKTYSNNYYRYYFENIELEKIDNYKLVFKLPVVDNFFIQKLSYFKIVPSKIWSKYNPENWKENEDELLKISSGPFVFNNKYNNIYEFKRNEFYHPLPYLEKILIYVYPNTKDAYEKIKIKEINSLGGLFPTFVENNLSQELKIENIIMPRIIAIFFNSQKVNLEEVKNFKNNLDYNSLESEIINNKYFEISNSIFSPSIRKIFSLSNKEIQKNLNSDIKKYNFKITIPDNYLIVKISNYLQKKYGFKVEIKNINELNNSIIPKKDYEALIYGISYRLMPDLRYLFEENSVFNLTNTTNPEIIKLIQELEIGKKENFKKTLENLDTEIDKLPIVFLINPYYIYILPKNLNGFNVKYLNDPSEKFVKIEEWYLK